VTTGAADRTGRLACPFCGSYHVDRLFLASGGLDACACRACGASWDEDRASGEFRGRSARASAAEPRR
jgi:hypothetical protein